MRRIFAALCLIASLALYFTLASCGRSQSRTATGKRIIVLGFDAMDPKFVERHWDDLPNLKRLRQMGESRALGTTVPPQSPVAWSTFTTGMDPGGHGVFDFIHRNPSTMMPFSSMAATEPPKHTLSLGPYEIPLSSGTVKTFRKGRAFWEMLDERGVPVTILRMPNNFPPIRGKGRTLSGMGTPDMRGTFGTFAFYTSDPEVQAREVAGGRIVRVGIENFRAILPIEGPDNTLRKDRRHTSIALTVDVDPAGAAARFRTDDADLILKPGEWSGWVRVRFPLIPALKSAAGMFRIYVKKLQPDLEVYISPVNIDPFEPELPISTPESFSRELAEAIGPYSTQGMGEDTAALREGIFSLDEYRVQSRSVSEEHLQILYHELDQFKSGLLFFHFFGIDQDSHIFWGKHEDLLLDTYKLADSAIGRVLAKAGDATVIVMSDHGFSTFDRAVHLNTWLMREGFLTLDDPENAGNQELFAHVDWSRTQAYSVGLNAIYLNRVGRERYGIVEPGEEQDRLVSTIGERLMELRDPASGKAVVERVYAAGSVYHGEEVGSAPDLIVGWAPGFRSSWQTALGAVPKNLIDDNTEEWRGDHCIAAESVPGIFVSNKRSRLDSPRLQDLTVSLLAEFGVSPATGMTGRKMF